MQVGGKDIPYLRQVARVLIAAKTPSHLLVNHKDKQTSETIFTRKISLLQDPWALCFATM